MVWGSASPLTPPLPDPAPEHPARRRPAAAGIATSASRECREGRDLFIECLSCDFIVWPACTGRTAPTGVLGAGSLSHGADLYAQSLFVMQASRPSAGAPGTRKARRTGPSQVPPARCTRE